MPIRSLPMSRAWTWFLQAVNLGVRNPRAVFGAALLMVATLYLLVMAGGLLGSLLGGGDADPVRKAAAAAHGGDGRAGLQDQERKRHRTTKPWTGPHLY